MIEDTFVTYCEIKTGMLADDASKAMEVRRKQSNTFHSQKTRKKKSILDICIQEILSFKIRTK